MKLETKQRSIAMAIAATALSQCTQYKYGVAVVRKDGLVPFSCGSARCRERNKDCGCESCTPANVLHSALANTLMLHGSWMEDGAVFIAGEDENGNPLPVELDSACWDIIDACRLKDVYVLDPESGDCVAASWKEKTKPAPKAKGWSPVFAKDLTVGPIHADILKALPEMAQLGDMPMRMLRHIQDRLNLKTEKGSKLFGLAQEKYGFLDHFHSNGVSMTAAEKERMDMLERILFLAHVPCLILFNIEDLFPTTFTSGELKALLDEVELSVFYSPFPNTGSGILSPEAASSKSCCLLYWDKNGGRYLEKIKA